VSEENVGVVRRGNELFNAGDWDAAFALYHPDAEYRDLQHGPDMPEVFYGAAGIRAVVAMWTEVYEEFGAEVYEYIDVHPWVVCDTRWYGRSKDSDVPVDVRVADAYEVQNGLIVRAIMSYQDVEAACKGVGLAE
jgi:ketosteroid isomerase-like protein